MHDQAFRNACYENSSSILHLYSQRRVCAAPDFPCVNTLCLSSIRGRNSYRSKRFGSCRSCLKRLFRHERRDIPINPLFTDGKRSDASCVTISLVGKWNNSSQDSIHPWLGDGGGMVTDERDGDAQTRSSRWCEKGVAFEGAEQSILL